MANEPTNSKTLRKHFITKPQYLIHEPFEFESMLSACARKILGQGGVSPWRLAQCAGLSAIVIPNERISRHGNKEHHKALEPKWESDKHVPDILSSFRSSVPASVLQKVIELTRAIPHASESFKDQVHCVDIVVGSEGRAGVELARHGIRVSSIEGDPVSLSRTLEYASEKKSTSIDLVPASVEQAVIGNESADLVTIFHGIHLLDIHIAMKEIHRILKPGGFLIVSFNDRDLTNQFVGDVEDILEKHIHTYNRYQKQHSVDEWGVILEEYGLFKLIGYFVEKNPLTVQGISALLDLLDCMSFVRLHVRGAARKKLHQEIKSCVRYHTKADGPFDIPIENKCFVLRKQERTMSGGHGTSKKHETMFSS